MLLGLCSCSAVEEDDDDKIGGNVDTSFELTPDTAFTDRDLSDEYDVAGSTVITLSGSEVKISGAGASASGSHITVSGDGSYIISGELTDGTLTVDAHKSAKPHIILSGASISSSNASPIYIKECDKLFITLADGTENYLAGGDSFTATGDGADGVIFSRQDLTINGSGKLTVSSPKGHGIVSKDDLVIAGGSYKITAASHGIDANDSIRMTSSTLEISATADGLHAENADDESLGFIYSESSTVSISCGGDGISSSASIQIESGSYSITSLSTSSADSFKGIKSVGTLLVNGASFSMNVKDDAIHSNTSVVINGGAFEISTGDDGIHADQTLYIGGGSINIAKSYEGLEALDIEIAGGDIKIVAKDDGINAAGGNDNSGTGGSFGGGDSFRPGGRPGPGSFGGPGGGAPGSGSSNGSIKISGGKIYMNASGDGIDANGTLAISGGEITVCGPTSGDTSVLDYDKEASITGGTFIGTGSKMMAQSFSSSSQGVIAVTLNTKSANERITITASDGAVILDYTPALAYQLIVISMPSIQKGETYTLSVGSSTNSIVAK